ncbi:MAG: aminotransferase class V-fold PLP-dependent enzyme [Chloroflexi bacterium]|nr:MAG: aminotransferase class V-fold PLP-dependent enzyme [Chloroflexota bacterium]TMF20750.1 MAG: aminotransferase class V-fold PLP-dependent enzyme [Chloroflexota bacterium]
MASPHSGQWREHFAGVDLPVPVYGGATATGINFDNAASTPPLNRVRDMVTTFSDLYSSVHRGTGYKSRLSTEAYEQARELVARFLNVDEKDQVVIFVKGTTDALNRIAAAEARLDGRQVLVTEMEHHADLLPWRHRSGHMMVGLSDEGHIDLEAIEQALKTSDGKISLVAICGASNVTGFVSPIHEVAALAHRYGARVSVDAAQLAPHHRIDVRAADDPGHLDFVSLSGHKMYAPYGAGVLVAPRDFFAGAPEVMGGGAISIVTWDDTVWADLPDREEAGSPNVIGAVALGVAIETLLELGFDEMLDHEVTLGLRLIDGLSEIPGVTVLGGVEPHTSGTRLALASFVVDGLHHGLVAAALSHEWGIAVRHGCFCANPYVFHLLHMSRDDVVAVEGEVTAGRRKALPGAVRASLAPYNTEAEVDRFLEAVRQVARGRIKATYEQAADGTYAPSGGWPRIQTPLHAIVKH